MRRYLVLPFLLLTMCVMQAHAQSDPAYVDSPQSKSVPDPARADAASGAGAGAGSAAANYRQEDDQMDAMAAAQAQAETDRQIKEQIEHYTKLSMEATATAREQHAQQAEMNDLYAGPPIGGSRMFDQVGDSLGQSQWPLQPGAFSGGPTVPNGVGAAPSPGQQIGSALIQDAAGIVDSHIQREINGPGGRVYFLDGSPGY